MGTGKRRGGYLATAEGVKKLKEAKSQKKYTYAQIQAQIPVTLDQVKRLFNPQWGNGRYKIGEDAVSLICGVLDLAPEDVVDDWHVLKEDSEEKTITPYEKALQLIEQVDREGTIKLNLSGLGLTELPPEIVQLTHLSELSLYSNSLSSLPPEIGHLTNLSVLNLNNNSLSSLPPEIGHLTNLSVLNLDSNSLSSLPPEIGHLTNLSELSLGGNSLSSLPPEIGQLTNLSRLYLGGNSLSSLPPEIGQLTNLSRLYLRNNSLSSLPPEIGQLTNLSRLYLGNNNLSSLPPEIVQLTNLSVLYLDSNSLSSLPPEIVQLTNLSRLDLNSNSLSSLPPEIGQLTNLSVLYLDSNSLSSLPPEIGQLTNLSVLDLNNNSLSSLPPEIGQLTNNLSVLYLDSNSLNIPPEVIEKYNEPAAIINYYLSLQNSKKPLHEAKMLLVGQGNVGKTCVRERLIRNNYDPTRNKTDGIDIEPWSIEIEDNNYQVNVWDFGGQEIMHSTHQFFLTKRSLYLLVLDTTIGEEENRIEYWLKIIQSFGEDSPVIIVGNKADQHPLDIDRKGLQDKYSQVKGIYEVSCQNSTGFTELAAKVTQEIGDLEHINDALPLPWFNVKQKLEGLDKDYIPYERYEAICESEKIDRTNNQRILIRLLNDLGIVLHFYDDPRLEDTHVLNPEWVTNGVYKILNDAKLIRDYKGILELKMLQHILKRDRYPTGKYLFIIDMMRKFEICFDIETNQKFLIPDLLPKGEPDTGEWDNILAFEYHYPVYTGSIISRFIVRMHKWISKHTYWRNGVVLAQEGNRALVKADREDKKIMIRVNGKESTRRNLLTAIRSDFDYIHSTIPGIVPTEKVPLLDFPDIPPVDYQWLLDLENKGVRATYVPGLTEEIDIRQLLNGIVSEIDRGYVNKDYKEGDRKSKYYQNKNRKPLEKPVNKEVFISYSWAEASKEITDKIDAAFQNKGIDIIRDTKDLGYKDRIKAFMENIGRGKCVVVVISQGYLQSANCLFELLQIAKNGKFGERIFPIVLPDAKIYKPLDRIKYIQYWEQEIKELDEAMKTVSAANLQGFNEDINLYTEIRNSLPQLMAILKDINALSIKIHTESEFAAMIEAVEQKLRE